MDNYLEYRNLFFKLDQNNTVEGLNVNQHASFCSVFSRNKHEVCLRQLEVMKATVKSLQTQLDEQTRNSHEQIELLNEDRQASLEGSENLHRHHEKKLKKASEQYVS